MSHAVRYARADTFKEVNAMNRARISITSVGLALLLAGPGCSSDGGGGGGGQSSGGSGGDQSGGSGGSQSGGSGGSSQSGGSGGSQSGGSGGSQSGGSGGGQGGAQSGGSGGGQAGSGGTTARGGSGGGQAGSGGTTARGGSGGGQGGAQSGGSGGGQGGTQANGGTTGEGGTTTSTGGTTPLPTTALVTSANGNFWKTGTWTESTSNATVTVSDSALNSVPWEGFGGSFNELGWKYLTSDDMKNQAMELLFGAEGTNLTWGRIPMGASDYAESRFTYDDTGSDVAPDGSESNRPPPDTSLSKFSLQRDKDKLIPYIKAALKVKSDIRFWASPWTPPVWMKTGYKKEAANPPGGNAKKPSYFDGGYMKNDSSFMAAYAEYYKKFVQGYKDEGINVEMVSPQNEPGYDQNYPSCLWESATYTAFLGKHLGPAMKEMNVKVMLGSLSNPNDLTLAQNAYNDSSAKPFLAVLGVQWDSLDKVIGGTRVGNLPIWVSEHRCGNYPWNPSTGCGDSGDSCPKYNSTQAPNDMAYGVESWKQIRNAITKGKVTGYSAWNMVLDKIGLGNDTSRDWRQNALLVADGGKINPTPYYYVFRHLAQYTLPGATVLSTSGGDAIAFKNPAPDSSYVVVMYNSGSANNNYVVSVGGKKLQFAMPGAGWATVKYKP